MLKGTIVLRPVRPFVRPFVRSSIRSFVLDFLGNPSLNFFEILHEVVTLVSLEPDILRFLKKKKLGPNLPKKGPKRPKNEVFGILKKI